MPNFNIANPFQPGRVSNIFNQPVDRAFSGVDFNPATSTGGDSPFQQGKFGTAKRLFSGTVPERKFSPQQGQGMQSGEDDTMQRYFDLLQGASQNRPARSAYANALNTAPDAREYAPSVGRRIAAGIAGAAGGMASGPAAGIATGEYINSAPYRSALESYGSRLQGLEAEAGMEDQDISDYRQNIITASQYANTRGDQARRFGIDSRKADTDYFQALSTARKNEGEMQHWERGDANADWARRNEAKRDANTAGYQGQQAGIGWSNAGANNAQAVASKINAEANMLRAQKYQPAKGAMPNYENLYNLVLTQMSQSGEFPEIKIDNSFTDPIITVGPTGGDRIVNEAKRRMAALTGEDISKFISPNFGNMNSNTGRYQPIAGPQSGREDDAYAIDPTEGQYVPGQGVKLGGMRGFDGFR